VNEVLDPLLRVPGVRCVVLGTPDGVPIASGGDLSLTVAAEPELGGGLGADAVCGLVAGWLASLGPSLGLVAWDLPQRIVLRAARNTIVVRRSPNALLIAMLDPGAQAEDLRLPMEGALARLQRVARRPRTSSPPPALPSRDSHKGPASENADNDVLPFANELPG
jgi:predicted regulator of Ras-like GTPase activity (Roadblock/LC7/MglB family)